MVGRKPLVEAALIRMQLPKRYWACSLEEVHETGGEGCPKDFALRYLSKLDEMMERGVGILLWGDNGRGKTGMASVIAKEARRRGKSVLFMPAASLKDAVVSKQMFDREETMIQRARSVDMLILDDLGKGTQDSKGFGARVLDELIRQRSMDFKVTIITTNMSPKGGASSQLGEELKRSTMSTLKEVMIPFHLQGPDKRDAAMSEIRKILEEDDRS